MENFPKKGTPFEIAKPGQLVLPWLSKIFNRNETITLLRLARSRVQSQLLWVGLIKEGAVLKCKMQIKKPSL